MSNKPKPKEFSLPKLIITEGEDDAHFIFSLLKFLKLDGIYIHWIKGKNKLLKGDIKKDEEGRNQISKAGLQQMVSDDEFREKVLNVAVIFDAGNNLQNSFNDIIKAFKEINSQQDQQDQYAKKVKFNLPNKINEILTQQPSQSNPNVAVFLLPNSKNNGALEDVYLSTLGKKEEKIIIECIDKELIACLKKKKLKIDESKVKTQSFLAIKDKTFKSIGFAASKDKINFNAKSDYLDSLKNFLIKFSNQAQ